MNFLEPIKRPFRLLPSPVQAGILVLSAVFLLGLSDNLVLLISDQSSIWQFHAIRSLMTAFIILVFAKSIGHDLKPKRPLFVLLRSLFLSCAILSYFGALSFLSVAEAGAGLFSSPLFVLIFSVIIFGIRVGFFRILAVMIGSVGVYILLQPDLSHFNLLQILPILSGMFYAMAALSTRQFCRDESVLSLTLAFLSIIGIVGAVMASILWFFPELANTSPDMTYFLTGWEPVGLSFLFWIAIQAILSVVALAMLAKAYQLEEASFLAVYEYGFLIFAAFWGWVLWSTVLGVSQIMGIFLIMVAGIIIIIRTARSTA